MGKLRSGGCLVQCHKEGLERSPQPAAKTVPGVAGKPAMEPLRAPPTHQPTGSARPFCTVERVLSPFAQKVIRRLREAERLSQRYARGEGPALRLGVFSSPSPARPPLHPAGALPSVGSAVQAQASVSPGAQPPPGCPGLAGHSRTRHPLVTVGLRHRMQKHWAPDPPAALPARGPGTLKTSRPCFSCPRAELPRPAYECPVGAGGIGPQGGGRRQDHLRPEQIRG